MSVPREAAAVLAAVLLADVVLPAQAPQFLSGVDIVVVEATVLDKSGAVVRGLEPGDFTAEFGGRARAVVSAELVEYATPSAEAAETIGDVDISTNEPMDSGRTVLLMVDQNSLRPESRGVLDAAKRWILALGPKDHVGLITFPQGGPRLDFTTDHARVADVLGKVVGAPVPLTGFRNISAWEAVRIYESDAFVYQQVVARECRRNDPVCPQDVQDQSRSMLVDAQSQVGPVLAALHNLVRGLNAIPGPKHILLVSGGWMLSEREALPEMRVIAGEAARTNVTLHTLTDEPWAQSASRSRPSATPYQDQQLLFSNVEALAGMTGGRSIRLTGAYDTAFASLSSVLSGYYRLGIRAEPEDLDGRPRRVSLEVSRAGASVSSYRRVLVAPPPEPPTIADPAEALRAALHSGTPITTLGIRATTYALHEAAGSRRLRIIVAGDVARATAGAGQVVAALFELDGKPVTAREAAVDIPSTGTGPIALTLEALPGTYVLRLVVRDVEGRMGTLERLVEARWHRAGRVETPGLVMFRAAPGASPEPLLDAVETTDEIVVQLALSGPARGTQVDLDVRPLGASAPLVRHTVPIVQTTGGQTVAHQTLTASQLPAGRYTIRATIGDTTFSRTFRVRVPQ